MISFYRCKPYTMEYRFNSPHLNYRLIADSDLQQFVEIYTNEQIMLHISDPISEPEAVSLFNRFLRFNNTHPQQHFLFSIISNINQELVGFCGVNSVKSDKSSPLKTGEIGVMLLETVVGKGCGTEVLRALVNHCFQEFGFKKLIGPPAPDNIASIKMLEKIGFEIETVLKAHLKIKGEQIDTPLYVLYKQS